MCRQDFWHPEKQGQPGLSSCRAFLERRLEFDQSLYNRSISVKNFEEYNPKILKEFCLLNSQPILPGLSLARSHLFDSHRLLLRLVGQLASVCHQSWASC